MTEQVVDPAGEALTTVMEYYDIPSMSGSHGRIASRTNPDGSWTKYHYDTSGRTTSVERGSSVTPVWRPKRNSRSTKVIS